jgi:hypothetical protein
VIETVWEAVRTILIERRSHRRDGRFLPLSPYFHISLLTQTTSIPRGAYTAPGGGRQLVGS